MNKRTALLLVGVIAAGLALSACGGSPAGPVTVNVTASEYKFETSMTSFKVGVPYHFVIKNEGVYLILSTGLAVGSKPSKYIVMSTPQIFMLLRIMME